MTNSKNPRTEAIIECGVNEPALIPAAFDLMRTYVRAYDLPDIEEISITMHVTFGGWPSDKKLSDFKHQLDQLWFGHIDKIVTKEREPESENA